jgi:cytochrome c biogenesis protein CcdA
LTGREHSREPSGIYFWRLHPDSRSLDATAIVWPSTEHRMRYAAILAGILLIALGAWIAMGKLSYSSTETPLKFGQIEVKTTVDKPVPAPVGYAGIVIGGVLLAAGVLKRHR